MPLVSNEREKILYPTEWTKRFETSEIALKYIEENGRQETEKNAKFLKKPNIKYGPGERQLLDIYYKDEENGTPIILYVHGGYWQEFSKDDAAYWIKPYVEKGYRVVIFGYDLCPAITLSELVDEIKAGLKFALEYAAETDTKTLSLIGHSAGAHLAIAALDKDTLQLPNIDLIKSVFLVAGIYDLKVLVNSTVNENNLLTLDESNVKDLSPLLIDLGYLKDHNFKFIVSVSEHESPLFIEQSEAFDKHLKEFGLNSEYKYMKDLDHMNIMEDFAKTDYELTQLLFKVLEN